MRGTKVVRETRKLVRMMIRKVRTKDKRPNNKEDPKGRMILHNNLNHKLSPQTQTQTQQPYFEVGAPPPHPKCLLM